jgi:hypothetical protein
MIAAAAIAPSMEMVCTGIIPGPAAVAAWSRTNRTPARTPRLIDAICGSNKAATRRVRDVDGNCQNFAAAARAVATFLLHKALRR